MGCGEVFIEVEAEVVRAASVAGGAVILTVVDVILVVV